MLKIILTGLIAYVPIYQDLANPDLEHSQVLAVLVAAADHEAKLYYDCSSGLFTGPQDRPDCAEWRSIAKDIKVEGLAGWALDSSGLYNPTAQDPSALVVMDKMKQAGGQASPGEANSTRLAQNSSHVAGRLLLYDGKIASRLPTGPIFMMIDSSGTEAVHPRRELAEVVEYWVEPPNPGNPVLEIDGETVEVKHKAPDGNWYIFLTNSPKNWCSICNTNALLHFTHFHQLAKHPGSAVPRTTNGCLFCCPGCVPGICNQCQAPGPGGNPVRCPGAIFNPLQQMP
jgi:hypothetical protein